MNKILPTPCKKCGGNTSIHYVEPEKSSGMDIRPLKQGGLQKTCTTCGYAEFIKSLDDDDTSKMHDDLKRKV